jgi:hypothetical protein
MDEWTYEDVPAPKKAEKQTPVLIEYPDGSRAMYYPSAQWILDKLDELELYK